MTASVSRVLAALIVYFTWVGQPAASGLEPHTVMRPDGSDIHYYLNRRGHEGRQSVLLVMQGSDCNSIARHPTIHEYNEAAPEHAVLYVEKYGITDSLPPLQDDNRKDCPAEYLRNDTPEQRVLDYVRVVSELRRTAEWWTGKLVILAGSEGAIIAEQVTVLVPETQNLVIFGFGSRWFETDLVSGIGASLENAPMDEAARKQELAKIMALFLEMRENPTAGKFASGHSYAHWASILKIDQMATLRQISVPVLAIQGTQDQNVSIEGARELIRELRAVGRTNITFKEYAGLDHGFRDSDGVSHRTRVVGDIREWLRVQ